MAASTWSRYQSNCLSFNYSIEEVQLMSLIFLIGIVLFYFNIQVRQYQHFYTNIIINYIKSSTKLEMCAKLAFQLYLKILKINAQLSNGQVGSLQMQIMAFIGDFCTVKTTSHSPSMSTQRVKICFYHCLYS